VPHPRRAGSERRAAWRCGSTSGAPRRGEAPCAPVQDVGRKVKRCACQSRGRRAARGGTDDATRRRDGTRRLGEKREKPLGGRDLVARVHLRASFRASHRVAHLCHGGRRSGRADPGGVARRHLERRVSRVATSAVIDRRPRSPKRRAKKCPSSPSPRRRARQPARPAAFSARATSRSGHPRRWRVAPLTRRRALLRGAEAEAKRKKDHRHPTESTRTRMRRRERIMHAARDSSLESRTMENKTARRC